MADISTFYPGGEEGNAVPISNTVDDNNAVEPLHFWTGTQAEYDAIAMAEINDPGNTPFFAETLYHITL